MLRRQQDLQDDKERVEFLRRPGLLSRVLVEHDGSHREAHPGGVDMAIAHVASAVAARRIVFGEARARSRASTPAPEEAEFLLVEGTSVLARHLQQEVLDRIYHNWKQTEQGQEFAKKARDKVDVAAQRKAQQAQRKAP